jgi:hypothetical protein
MAREVEVSTGVGALRAIWGKAGCIVPPARACRAHAGPLWVGACCRRLRPPAPWVTAHAFFVTAHAFS